MGTKPNPIRAYAARKAGAKLEPFEYDPGALGDEQVEVRIEHCGICHSDLSMVDNEWSNATFPLVPGHEIVGTIVAAGPQVKRAKVGDKVGIGWYSASCTYCEHCLAGHQNYCVTREQTIVGRHGGFADRVRCHWTWATPLPEGLDVQTAGPLFCGGITVFGPMSEFGVKPTDRVGVVGIGGLGHLALQFANAFGCEVTAFSSNPAKHDEARKLGAHHVVSSTERAALKKVAAHFDFIIVTSNVTLDWKSYINALAPRGRLHVVGGVMEPIPVEAFSLISGRKSVSGSPLGDISTTMKMLEFCARHGIEPQVERFPMSKVNAAMDHLRAGKARHRIILDADFA